MTKASWRSSLLIGLVLLTVAVLPAMATFEPASCDDVATWVAEHRDQLPETLADFATVPEGYEAGVFNILPVEMRNELWHDFLNDYAQAKGLQAGDVSRFADLFDRPTDFVELDVASTAQLETLMASFTLRMVDPIADLVVDSESLGKMAINLCSCSRTYDLGCSAFLCLPQEVGCGPFGGDPCTGLYFP